MLSKRTMSPFDGGNMDGTDVIISKGFLDACKLLIKSAMIPVVIESTLLHCSAHV